MNSIIAFPLISDNGHDYTLQRTPQNSSSLLSCAARKYSIEAVEGGFIKFLDRLKPYLYSPHAPSTLPLELLDFNIHLKTKAQKLANFFAKNFERQMYHICQQVENKILRKLTSEELEAKIYGLALRTLVERAIYTQIHVSWDKVNLSKIGQQAPHIKLLGQLKHKLCYIKVQGLKEWSVDKQDTQLHLIYAKLMGKGTHNKAFHVYHLENAQEFVLRELKEQQLSPYLIQVWEKEAISHQTLMHLKIPGIVKLHAVYEFNSEISTKRAMLLEKCEGDLFDLPQEISAPTCHLLIEQIINSLIALHAHGYVHQDIKPSNIFYKYENNQIQSRIGDFTLLTKIELPSLGIGTYFYQPWDAFCTTLPLSFTSDCWAVGMIAYHLKYCIT